MKTAYRAIAYLIAGLVAAQAAFIAFAWFTVISQVEDGTAFTENSRATPATRCTASARSPSSRSWSRCS